MRIEVTPERRISGSADGSETWDENAVLEWDPPHRLSHEWRSFYDPELAAEEKSRVTWEIEQQDGGFSKLTVIHDRLDGAPKTAASVSGAGWMMVLSGLKSVLETGRGSATPRSASSDSRQARPRATRRRAARGRAVRAPCGT